MDLFEHFQALLAHEKRCTPLVIDALRQAQRHVEEVGLATLAAPLERARAIFGHMQAARQLWLSRISDLSGAPEGGVFPAWTMDQSSARAHQMDDLWAIFLSRQTPGTLTSRVRYHSTEGQAFESSISEILVQVITHSAYHRGQIASLIAATGTKPPVTDFIALTRIAI